MSTNRNSVKLKYNAIDMNPCLSMSFNSTNAVY